MELEQTKFYSYVETFFKERGQKFENQWDIHRSNELPFDSVDRLIALYLLDNHPEMVALSLMHITSSEQAWKWYTEFDEEFKKWFDLASNWAYNNYEREWISNAVALVYILAIAKQGLDEVLTNSYANGGWFGAS